ncbi:Cyclin C-terminal domain [Arabidopsis suecica]|uniref:Cyclin C-terminal domain n=1 Tax=Arabidopsis suecica TaxID=45249 RepID=A0A8T2HIM2_ARASU|nr:Cyclin C-terminal domain [Arabidopsis suecica]
MSSSSRNLSQENPIPRPNLAKTRTSLRDVGNRRAPLGDITNQKNGSRNPSPSSTLVNCSNKIGQSKKAPKPAFSRNWNLGILDSGLPPKPNAKSNIIVPYEDTELLQSDDSLLCSSPALSLDASPTQSDPSISTHDSLTNHVVDYMVESTTDDGNDDDDDEIVNIDSDLMDPQLCASFACDIYEHLRVSEVNKRPALDYMERTQSSINASMRSILIDWLVEVAEEYRLSPETLYLAVNYVDRYLTGNAINKQNLQLLGVTCMMIAAKYEEVCVPQVEDFCYITDNTYLRNELLEMESSVLNYLKFELTTPTAKCFLRRFLRAAQGRKEVPSLLSECLACYLTELSLLDYAMLRYAPSLVAASAVFLAQYTLHPSRKPWNATLEHYTSYRAKHMEACVKNLLQLCNEKLSSDVVAIRKKYSQHKYKFAAKKLCPTSLPQELFL